LVSDVRFSFLHLPASRTSHCPVSKSVNLIKEVLQRLEEQTFTVAIVGEFRRGKSTLINALLGQDILPSDILPTTATLNRVTYGLKPSAKILYKDGQEETIPYEQLSNYVTKLTDESERKAASVKEAVIYYPVPYCQNKIDILDTPGLNDDQNMTEVTLGVLPFVDAAIMIMLAQSPFSDSEQNLLKNKLINQDLGRIIFVLNIWDTYTPDEAKRLLDNVKKRIQIYVFDQAEAKFGKNSEEYQLYRQKIGEPKVFGIYIKKALESKQKSDEDGLVASGFHEFEIALEQFLTKERGIILLQVPMNRTIGSAKEILTILNIQEKALSMEKGEFESKYQSSVTEIETVRKRHKKEVQLVDGKAANVKMLVRPYLYELPNQIKQAASKTIDDMSIDPKDLKDEEVLGKKISSQVSNTVQQTTSRISQQIQNEIQKGIDQEVERLEDFAHSVEQALNNIEMQFVQIEASSKHRTSGAADAITAAISVFTGFGGIWSGYRVAGVKGAAVGAAGSVGTAVGGGLIYLARSWIEIFAP
jgi:ribosome biogenesis GTPase A